MEKLRIGHKTLINGGKRSDKKIRLVLYIPQRIIDALSLVPGDEVEIGEIYKTGLNLHNKRGMYFGKKENEIRNEQGSSAPEAESSPENRIQESDSKETQQLS